ncbi:MAG: GNAT family N-acetyltransferase [Leptolyngbyaceae cyanobacterium]
MAYDIPMEMRIAMTTDATAIIAFDHVAASESARVQFIHDQIKSSACYVAVIDANVVAYAVLNYKFYDNGWIEMLYVHPRFRRQGIGSALICHLINECRTAKLFTSTNQSNFPMQRLLATLEFERSGVIENLDEGDPEWVYIKRLLLKLDVT